MWAISSIQQEQLQIRCLKETQVIQIRPPLQVVYVGNGCEGYSPSMYIPAKSELSGTEEIESRKEYFLKFNYVYQPDGLVGVWWQFRSKLMTVKEAENFIEKVEPLGTMDYSILNRQLEKVDNKYPWSLPVPPMALVVGIGFMLILLGGIVFAIKLYRVGITVREAKGIAKTVTTQPLSCFRSILRRSPQDKIAGTEPTSQVDPEDVGTKTPQREELDLHPIRMRDILQTVLQDERTGIKYGEILGPASQTTRTRGAQLPLLPNTGVGGTWSHPPRLQFVRLSPTAKPPTRSTEGAIGYDLYTPFSFTRYPREIKLVYTDIAIKVPPGHYGRIAPKSGLTLKHHVTVLAGVIDPDYTGNVGMVLHNLSSDTKFTRLVGQTIGQLILEVASIFPTLEVGELPITAWGPYGFGSHD